MNCIRMQAHNEERQNIFTVYNKCNVKLILFTIFLSKISSRSQEVEVVWYSDLKSSSHLYGDDVVLLVSLGSDFQLVLGKLSLQQLQWELVLQHWGILKCLLWGQARVPVLVGGGSCSWLRGEWRDGLVWDQQWCRLCTGLLWWVELMVKTKLSIYWLIYFPTHTTRPKEEDHRSKSQTWASS